MQEEQEEGKASKDKMGKKKKAAKGQEKAAKAASAGSNILGKLGAIQGMHEISEGTIQMTFPIPSGSACLAHDISVDAWPTQGQMFTLANLGMTGEHSDVTRRAPTADPEDRVFTFRTPILLKRP